MTISKLAALTKTIERHPDLFRCPKCGEDLHLSSSSLACANRHSFDLSKRGYLHLLMKSSRSVYDNSLFDARKRTCDAGFFQPLVQAMAEFLDRNGLTPKRILDAGCGEGSLTKEISKHFADRSMLCCGIDIAKEGILLASREASDVLWVVGDLANLPFQDGAFDGIINILSPANYGEFSRVLASDGFILKVLPGSGYLKEFRQIFYGGKKQSSYTNDLTRSHFAENMDKVLSHSIRYDISPDENQLADLISMTPLLLNKTPDPSQEEALKKIQTIGLDYEILLGWPKGPKE